MRRGEIWWAIAPDPAGSEPGYRRPVLVLSSDSFGTSQICTVVAVAITSNLGLALTPGNMHLPARGTGLTKPSVANVSQIVTVDKAFLARRAGRVSSSALAEVEKGMRLVLGL